MILPVAAQFLSQGQAAQATGAVVVIDVLRAFTTAAYAIAGGADQIVLVADVAEAHELKRANAGWLAMGENRGRRVPGFDLSNSPVEVWEADVSGRTIVQRTSAGTCGVVAARRATRRWCSSLVCATATANAVSATGLSDPSYVITGDWPDRTELRGDDDRIAADFIEAVRTRQRVDAHAAAKAVANSAEAARTIALGAGHVDPADIEFATRVDYFDFALEATQEEAGLVLRKVTP